jgi:hypothetical protein
MVVRPKHVEVNLNKIVNNCGNRVALAEPDLIHATGCKQLSLSLQHLLNVLVQIANKAGF